ncbi:MAG: ABC transporter substrate-binding protein [Acetobacter sp.]|nr:ABC transporter substrate-binding protein [Bacteroides sp.]MCM1342068.1 ABC transporter substrate-binding protein [Acetobacter sp.]MCM1432736.1 ABC transporter substrate-binding protein [Clostridiales bacterium]
MQKRYFALILAIILLVTALASCTKPSSDDSMTTTAQAETKKETDDVSFKLSYTQSDSLNPFEAKTQNNQILASLVFESLFDIDENYEVSANIATGYAYTDSKTIRVDINPNLKFSDNSSIDTDDILYSINSAIKSPAYKNALNCFSYAEKNGNSVFIHLRYANPYAVNLLTFPIVSTEKDKKGYPVGSGRYSFSSVAGETILKANESDDFAPYITTISLVNIAAADSIDNAVNIGNISFAFRDLSTDTSKRISCAKKAVNMNNLIFIGINSMSGATSDAKIRQAISLAIDRAIIAESAYSGYASPASSLFNPYFKATENVNLFSKSADSSTAKQAVSQSGYNDKELTLTILVSKNENKLAAATLIKNQLEAVGFNIKIASVNDKEYTRRVKNVEFDLYIGEVKLGDDMNLYPFFSKKGAVHYGINSKMSTPSLYTNYLSGETELGKLILSFNEEMPFIPIAYKKGMICYSKAMNGDMQGYYGNFFSNIDSWNFIA